MARRQQHPLNLRAVARSLAFSSCWLCLALLAGCEQHKGNNQGATPVRAQRVELSDHTPKITLAGEIAARAQSDLSFRVTGRIIERRVDVGAHVEADEILARLEPREQSDDVEAANASVQAAEAKLKQASSSFDRKKALLGQGFTTQRDYDQAEQDKRVAQAALDNAHAQLAVARDQLSHTTLRAPSSGVITARNMEIGQVAQAAQTVFKLAQDGPRDAVVHVQESVFGGDRIGKQVEIVLMSKPGVKTTGEIREIAPVVDGATGAVRVKIGLSGAPPEMILGSTVMVTAHREPRKMVVLPWSALTSDGGKPAVWLVEPQTRTVTLRQVGLESFGNSDVVIREGLHEGELVVTAGAHLLRPAQNVALAGEERR